MKETRLSVSLGLEARVKAGVKVRQPLSKLILKNIFLKDQKDYLDLIKDEVNVKEVVFDESISDNALLDATITPELKEEGTMRDIVRMVQELRKNKKLNPGDLVELVVDTDESGKNIFDKFKDEISKTTGLSKIIFETLESNELVGVGDIKIKISLK